MRKITRQRISDALHWRYYNHIKLPLYNEFNKLSMPYKIRRVRSKKVIDVLFIITEVGPWKTKELYLEMVKNPRFSPIIGVSESREVPQVKTELMEFLNDLSFPFVDLDKDTKDVFKQLSPDIIFYQKPYDGGYREEIRYTNHFKSLFCYVYYAFRTSDVFWSVNLPLFDCVWQQYFENTLTASPHRLSLMNDKGKSAVITGLPIQDQLSQTKDHFDDPWKNQSHPKKRIIYAPHHTIADNHLSGLALSSFLENGQLMLELMHKYEDEVQWIFKPHPLLYNKLVTVWGKEKTDNYYAEWKNSDNSQYENGQYDAIFKYSDAMIHDCCSFTVEYHYTKNPVMYLMRKHGRDVIYNEFGQKAFDLHYKGVTKDDIEGFIRNVIKGVDPLKEKRERFYNEHLIPPHGKTACENIINAILGEAEYKDK